MMCGITGVYAQSGVKSGLRLEKGNIPTPRAFLISP